MKLGGGLLATTKDHASNADECEEDALHRPNEKEISHGRVPWANTLKLLFQGTVGFIDWLDLIMKR